MARDMPVICLGGRDKRISSSGSSLAIHTEIQGQPGIYETLFQKTQRKVGWGRLELVNSRMSHSSYYLCCWRQVWGQMSRSVLGFRGCKRGCVPDMALVLAPQPVPQGVTSTHQASSLLYAVGTQAQSPLPQSARPFIAGPLDLSQVWPLG